MQIKQVAPSTAGSPSRAPGRVVGGRAEQPGDRALAMRAVSAATKARGAQPEVRGAETRYSSTGPLQMDCVIFCRALGSVRLSFS